MKDSLVSSLQFCKAKDAELAWIDGVLDMRVSKVDTGVILEEGELKDDGEDPDMQVDVPSDPSVIAQQKAMKSLFGDDEKEAGDESEIIPTLEPLPPHEVSGHCCLCPLWHAVLAIGGFCCLASLQHRWGPLVHE